jgi:phage repressor protein C with HTH and peptisase S24 domain
MANDVLGRIEERLQAVGLSAAAASTNSGLSPDAIRNIQRSAKKGRANVTLETLEKLAPTLRTTVGWLASGAGDAAGEVAGLVPDPRQVLPVYVAGTVEAGAFREVDDLDQSEPEILYEPPDAKFPNARRMAFLVSGDSMNNLKPRPIFAGDRAVCVSYEDVMRQVPIIDGMVVVVERTRHGGQSREWSIKQVEIHADRVEFHPRSTNPRHKPIVVSKEFDADDGTAVEVIALVRRVVNDLPLS